MQFHTLRPEQWIPRPINEVFAFFADARNLEEITPPIALKRMAHEDQQIRGPFAQWIHRHEFESAGNATRLIDRIEYRIPGGALPPNDKTLL